MVHLISDIPQLARLVSQLGGETRFTDRMR